MGYFAEVHINQKRKLKDEVFEIIDISCSNIESPQDYIIAVTLKNEEITFQTNIETVIKDYQLVKA
ncbi:hypothetical protein [Changchengzhania lutea]|uniref:hypothetical protein n=1 Tax=Changchengzhania lutea TaxID=2049305 RepID=UPI00115D3F6F|nr:hypothetical protein [Changchengzhania lutea]